MNVKKTYERLEHLDSLLVMLDDGAKAPVRAHDEDAGLDLFNFNEGKTVIPALGKAVFHTGVHVEIPYGYYGKIESKSGLNVKHGVVSCGGVIDSGYGGEIMVALYNLSSEDFVSEHGDKIAQLIVQKCELPAVVIVNEISSGERGDSGFGSTGRK